MWILILTIVGSAGINGHTVTGVPGFTSQQACLAAAEVWLKQPSVSMSYRPTFLAMCAKA